MRLNFTGRRKIDKQHVRVLLRDDPPGSGHGYYFELALDLSSYQLPSDAQVFVEASRSRELLMRFDLGTVASPATLTPGQRRLSDFYPGPDRVDFRIKVVQPNGPDAGKLLAEADGLAPSDGATTALLRVVGADDLGDTPYSLELVPTDAALPVLRINTRLGGKAYANDPLARPLLMTAVIREVYTTLVRVGEVDEDPEHWANLWSRFAVESLGCTVPPEDNDEQALYDWVESVVNAFARAQELATDLEAAIAAGRNLQELEEME